MKQKIFGCKGVSNQASASSENIEAVKEFKNSEPEFTRDPFSSSQVFNDNKKSILPFLYINTYSIKIL
jgi:hypothetical protein